MNEKIISDLIARVQRLEDRAARIRLGTVTSRSPINVATSGLTSDDDAFHDVRAVGAFNEGSKVASILVGKDHIVLGRIGYGMTYGAVNVTNTGGDNYEDVIIEHNLTQTPHVVLGTIGEAANAGLNVGVQAKNATDFTLRLRHIDATTWTSAWVYWLAIGGE